MPGGPSWHFNHDTSSFPFGTRTFCVGELDDQLVRLDVDPDDMSEGFQRRTGAVERVEIDLELIHGGGI